MKQKEKEREEPQSSEGGMFRQYVKQKIWDFPGGSVVKTLPAKQETQVQSLGCKDPLEKEMATSPVFLPEKSHGKRSLMGHSCKELNATQ